MIQVLVDMNFLGKKLLFCLQRFEKKLEKISLKTVKCFCEKLCQEPETKGNLNIEKVKSNRSEEGFDFKPKLDSWPEPSKLVPIERED